MMILDQILNVLNRAALGLANATISKQNLDSSSHYYQVVTGPHHSCLHLPMSHLFSHPHGALLHQDFAMSLDMLNFAPPIN